MKRKVQITGIPKNLTKNIRSPKSHITGTEVARRSCNNKRI